MINRLFSIKYYCAIPAILFVGLVVSCTRFTWGDVTNYKEFKDYKYQIGSQYVLRTDLEIVGIRLDYPSKKIDYYALMNPKKRQGGPEFVFRQTLPTGSIIEIVKIFKLFPITPKSSMAFGIRVLDHESLAEIDLRIDHYPRGQLYTILKKNNFFSLNSAYFQRIPGI